MNNETAVIVGIIALIVASFAGGHGIGRSHTREVDYFITLDHFNIKMEDKQGKIEYFDSTDGLYEFINKDNL